MNRETSLNPGPRENRRAVQIVRTFLVVCLGVTSLSATEASKPRRQLLVVAPGYWRAGDAGKFSFEVYDLDAGGKRVHQAEPGKVGEIRGICFSPATQRLYVSGHEGMLCYSWPDKKLLWHKPVEGRKPDQNDAIAITVDGARIYTVRHFGKGLNVYHAATGERLRVIHERDVSGGRFSQVTHDGARLFVSTKDILILDTASEAVLGRFKPVMEPVRFAFSPDGQRFIYATRENTAGAVTRRSVIVQDAADGRLLHEIPVPAWQGMASEGARLEWLALSPDGAQAWVCDYKNPCLHRFDLAADPPRYAGRCEAPKGTVGLMYSVDGRFLVDGSGAVRDPADGAIVGRLSDGNGKPCAASNNMLALEADTTTGRVLRTNQQCAPVWPGPAVGVNKPISSPSEKEPSHE